MSSGGHEQRPIIVVKKHGAHDDDHGGHWKIAYADFVTAMMAFFLVMWLLSSVSEKQKLGIARYFSAASISDLRAGDGMMDGSRSALNGADSQMVPVSKSHEGEADSGEEASAGREDDAAHAKPATSASSDDRTEQQQFNAIKGELDQMTRQGELREMSQNISVQMTPDGLRVQIFDRDGQAMFAAGSAEPNRRLTMILDALMPVLASVRNEMIITGHTDNQKLSRPAYTNWELSADRANATRRYAETHGLMEGRIFKVEGRSASDPLLPQAPDDPRNRRIALTLLRNSVASQMHTAPQSPEKGT